MEDTVYIYGLVDPRNGDVRYVGKTNDIAARHIAHVSEASTYLDHCESSGRCLWNRRQRPKVLWMAYVFRLTGEFPDIIILDTVSVNHWERAEEHWIRRLLSEGKRLTNATTGGASSKEWRRAKERALAILYDEFGQTEVRGYSEPECGGESEPRYQSPNKSGLRESRIVWANPLMLVHEVSEMLNVTDSDVTLLIREGSLPALKLGGWRVRREDVDAYLKRTMEEQAENKE